jgi:hypothetical protein
LSGRTRANRSAPKRTCSGTDRSPSSTSDRGTQAGPQQRADDRGADLPVVGLLRTARGLAAGKLLAQRLITLKSIE